jgi:hypothetical protein
MRVSRQSYFLLLVVSLVLTAHQVSQGETPSPGSPADSIQLPSGAIFKVASFQTKPIWREVFPPDRPFYAEKHAEIEAKLRGMHARALAKLDGPSVTLYENGNIKTIANYPGGKRQGPFRVWDEDKSMILYTRFKDDKKHGLTCLFKAGVPWLVQEWKAGELVGQSVVARKENEFVPVDDGQQLAQAQKRLSAVEKDIADDEDELKKRMADCFAGLSQRIGTEQEKSYSRALAARSLVKRQANRQAEVGLHSETGILVGREKAVAENNANAVVSAEEQKLQQMNAALEKQARQLYDFALDALEEAMPSVPKATKPVNERRNKKIFSVTYRRMHIRGNPTVTDLIQAESEDDAKKEVLKKCPFAEFQHIEEK